MARRDFINMQVLLYLCCTLLGVSNAFTCPSGYTGFLPDHTDCSRYYQCFWGQTYQFTCPAGTLWNPNANYCDWPYNVQCSSSSTTTTTTTTTAAPTAIVFPTVGTSTTSSSCEEYVSISSSWTGNMGGKLFLPVQNKMKSYTLTVTTDIPLTKLQLWNGDVTPSSGTTFTITPKSWFWGKSPGSVLSLGFQASFQGSTKPVFTSIVFDDKTEVRNMCRSNGIPTNAPTQSPTSAPTTLSTSTVASTTNSGLSTAKPVSSSTKKIVCYFPNWPYYRQGQGKYFVPDIDPTICTHFIYSFAVLDDTTLTMKVFDTWLDIDLKGYEQFVALKQQHPEKKFLIALGGWTDSRTSKYSNLLKDSSKRANFVSEAVKFIQKYGFDGLDLDYEYPAYQQSASEKQTFAAWCKELKDAFRPYGWELTAAVAAGKDKIDAGYDVPEISKHLDAIHIMSYDLHGSWESTVNHHAPMTSSTPGDYLTVNYAVKYWLQNGCPKEKLVVGIPTYGRTFTLASSSNTGLGASAIGGGTAGPITASAGFLGYQEVCLKIAEGGWTVNKATDGSRGPFAIKGNQWIGYDDPETAKLKAQYILDNDLGGAMFWDLPSDDFNNRCGSGTYPIIRTVYQTLSENNK